MTDEYVPPSTEEALARLDMPLDEAMRTQRAVRRLHTDPVDWDVLKPLLELALKAPTSSNSQDWVFLLVTDPAQKRRLKSLYAPIFRIGAIVEGRAGGDDPKKQSPGEWQFEHFDELPVLVIPCYRRNLMHRNVGWPWISVSSYYGSVYPAVQNFLLGCRAVGLGASLQTMPVWLSPVARRILELPRDLTPVCLIPVGWARGKYGPTTRPAIEDVVHVDRYGNQPYR